MVLLACKRCPFGINPTNVIKHMSDIIVGVEDSPLIKVPHDAPTIKTNRYISKAICHHAALMANDIDAKAISTLTNSGYTAFQLSSNRPKAGIFIFTSNKPLLKTINLIWGVRGFYYNKEISTDATIADLEKTLKEKGHIKSGDVYINTTSMPIDARGKTNMIKMSVVE